MRQSSSVLLLDDGELDDVQAILEGAGIAYGRVRGASIVEGMPGPTDLLVTTPRHLGAVADVADGHPDDSAPVRIVVAQEDSSELRQQLRRRGFDYIVRRPVHPEALRLLVLHALYSGEERRTEPRVSIGCEITFKSGLIPRTAILADLSTRGCRLLMRRPLDMGRRLKLHLPVALGASEPIAIRGQVVRSRFDDKIGDNGMFSVGVCFEKVPSGVRQELEWIIEARSEGPFSLDEGKSVADEEADVFETRGIREIPASNLRADPRYEPELGEQDDDSAAGAEPAEEKPLAEVGDDGSDESTTTTERPAWDAVVASLSDRRRVRRAAFAAKVPAFGSRALRVLVGRDLSLEGMRVEPNPELSVGDRLHLAIYGNPDEEPFLVWATVQRDDGERGIAIAFDELEAAVAEQLEKLVVSLPTVEALQDGELDAIGTVIGERLETDGT
jgi:hypothetical protein